MLMKVIVMRRSKQSNQITNNLKHITEVSKAYSKSVKSSIPSMSPRRQMTTRQNVKMSISKATKHQVPSYVSYIYLIYIILPILLLYCLFLIVFMYLLMMVIKVKNIIHVKIILVILLII